VRRPREEPCQKEDENSSGCRPVASEHAPVRARRAER
jgi:hypothetical protein